MSTPFKKVKNRVVTTIKVGSSINNTDDPVTFNITDAAAFPVAPFYITVEVINDDTTYERMLCTDLTGDQITATRAQDGSSKQTFSAGDLVMVRVIAAHFDDMTDAVNDLEDIKDYVDSPMIVSGGEVSEGTNAGTFKVADLTALLRKTDSLTGELTYVTLSEQDNQTITAADTTYFVCLDYNGGTPQIVLSETNPYARTSSPDRTQIPIGKVMKDGSDNVHYISGGFNFQDGVMKLHQRAGSLRSHELQSGSAIEYSGTNNFTMEAGVFYAGINRITIAQYDSASTQFTGVRGDGGAGWTEALSNVIDYAHYDDGAGGLGNVANNKYGCHWVYRHIDDGHVYVRLGMGSYTLAEAEVALEPTKPSHLTDFGALIGKIIAPYNGSSFTEVQMVTERFFTGTAVSDHGNLTGLADDDHTQYALLAGRASGQTLIGGTASGEDLTLQSTSDGTKGYIYLGAAQTSYFDEVNEDLIITGDIGSTGTRVNKGWFTDLEVTNPPTINGSQISSGDLSDTTTVGGNVVSLTNPSAETFIKIAADNTVSTRTPANVMADLSGHAGAAFDFNSQNLTSVGTLGCGAITTSGDLVFSSDLVIRRDTADGSDNGLLSLTGGGAISSTRGAYILLYGNEAGGHGRMRLIAGNDATNGSIEFSTQATTRLDIEYGGDFDFQSNNLKSIGTLGCGAITSTGNIKANTSNYVLEGSSSRAVLRKIQLAILDGTNANTLKCTVTSKWNGDAINQTDNIAKNATTGNFTLDDGGDTLTIEAAGLTGNVIMAMGYVRSNASEVPITLSIDALSNDIRIRTFDLTGSAEDLTALVDTGNIYVSILYLTSE